MTYEAMKQKLIDELVKLKVGTPEYANAAKALAEFIKAEAEVKKAEAEGKKVEAEIKKTETEGKRAEAEFKKAEAEFKKAETEGKKVKAEEKRAEAEEKKIEAEAWKCESNETVAKTEAKAAIIRSAIDGGVKVICAIVAADVARYGYELITDKEKVGCCVSAVKGFIPKLKFF